MQIKHGHMLSNLLIMEAVVGHNFLVVPHVLCDILKKETFMTRGQSSVLVPHVVQPAAYILWFSGS